jgi:hypothetical protein
MKTSFDCQLPNMRMLSKGSERRGRTPIVGDPVNAVNNNIGFVIAVLQLKKNLNSALNMGKCGCTGCWRRRGRGPAGSSAAAGGQKYNALCVVNH